MFSLYALVDPRDDEIRYVGITCKALGKRRTADFGGKAQEN